MDPAIPVLIDTNFEGFSSEITTGRLVIYIYAVSKTRHVWHDNFLGKELQHAYFQK